MGRMAQTYLSVESARGRGKRAAGSDQAVLDGVARQLGIVLELHLFQHARAIHAYRLYGQAHLLGRIGQPLARSDQTEGLVLAVGKRCMGRLLVIDAKAVGHRLGQRRREVFAAPGDLPDRGRQLGGRALFRDIARSAGFEGA